MLLLYVPLLFGHFIYNHCQFYLFEPFTFSVAFTLFMY